MPHAPAFGFAKPSLPMLGCWPSNWAQLAWWQPFAKTIQAWEKNAKKSAVLSQPDYLMGGDQAILLEDKTGWVAHGLNALKAQSNLDAPSSALPHFVPQAHLPAGRAYEAFIHATGQVPTRDNWHDLLNGLIWLHLPHTKHQLNRMQSAEIARHGVQAKRGPVRDACTVFDENAALLFAPDALWAALQERRWHDLFGPLRPLWQDSRLLVFGHAALEKLLTPYKSITVHVWRVATPFELSGNLAALDACLANDLHAEKLARKPFCPLPVLGTPNWWPANAAPDFYNDPQVFRPARAAA